MRRALFYLTQMGLCLALTAQPVDDGAFQGSLHNFEKEYNLFLRRLQGCPDQGPTDTEGRCIHNVSSGYYDSKQWFKARKAAERLFQLKED